MIVNLDEDGYKKSLNHRKSSEKRKNNLLKTKSIKKQEPSGGLVFTFSLPGGAILVNGQWFIVSYDSANKQKHHKSHRMQ